MNNKFEMVELIDKLTEAGMAYYQKSESIMSDKEYDKLYSRLQELENETGVIMSNSPTQRVGSDISSSLKPVEHSEPMLSLDKTKDIGELSKFLGDKDGVLSWKMDGLTTVLTYNNGYLEQAVTRGNGLVGEDVTENVKNFENVPIKIAFKDRLVVRGESIITYSEFNKIGETSSYKNPRNLCSGTVRNLDPRVVRDRHVRFIAFRVIEAEGFDCYTYIHSMTYLESLGFEVVKMQIVGQNNLESWVKWFENEIANNDIPSDGLVLTFNDLKYAKSLESTAKFPKHSMAFKWQDECYETIVTGIRWQPSKFGLLTPVVEFMPVDICGTTVSNATAHNLKRLVELGAGVGATISVYKANMIIPHIDEVLGEKKKVDIPKNCPYCGKPTHIIQMRGSSTSNLYCTNPDCIGRLVKKLEFFCSRDGLDIEGLAGERIEQLVMNGLIRKPVDIFHLKDKVDQLCDLENFPVNGIISEIELCRETTLPKLLYSLAIPGVGTVTARNLSKHFSNSPIRVSKATIDELIEIDGIGQSTAQDIHDWFENGENKVMFDKLAFEELRLSVEESIQSPIYGNTFVVTGDVYLHENRNQLLRKIASLGGLTSSAVSRKTNYLICNDLTSKSTKALKAKELGVEIITEVEFMDMVRDWY